MAKKDYDWENGAVLEEHSKKKHSVLKEYFRQYLITRCQVPHQERFRLAIVDGFSGGGLYKCGSYGSPLIFVNTLIEATNEINFYRTTQGCKTVIVDCLLIFNDYSPDAISQLKINITPHLIRVKEEAPNLNIQIEYHSSEFEIIYEEIKKRLVLYKTSNVLFNLDQCGYSNVTSHIIRDIISTWRSAEVILTFMIDSMLAFLSPYKKTSYVPLEPEMREKIELMLKDKGLLSTQEWLGEAEKIAYTHLKGCAAFVSPFSINNPTGWRYWLMHFANSHRARQVYNNILHNDTESQAHFGRSGLNMFSYTPDHKGALYLFNTDSRKAAKEDLYDDIPRLVAQSGDAMSMIDFYGAAYSETPAHSDDIHEMIIENPDLEVITETGGSRRKANTIKTSDVLKLTDQRNIIFTY